MSKNKKDGFTLVELLAVIVILAVILVIAVPSIMNVIAESRKGALASSAKLIASSAETAYISNQTLGIEKTLTCQDVSNYNETEDYTCDLQIEDGKAKVTLIGKGKFDGMAVCGGTKEEAEVEEPINGKCPTPFEKDSWATIKAAVTARDTSKYKVGDTKTVELDINDDGTDETYTLRIANNSHYTNEDENNNECKDTTGNALASETACGFVVEFADIIIGKSMNSTGTNLGGWPASAVRKYLNDLDPNDNTDGVIYNALVSAIGNIIIPTSVVSGHERGVTTNYTTTDKLYLLSPEEVYGSLFTDSYDDSKGSSRQLDYYNGKITSSDNSAAIKNGGSTSMWWFRSAPSSDTSNFCNVMNTGNWNGINSSNVIGVSPAFRLG